MITTSVGLFVNNQPVNTDRRAEVINALASLSSCKHRENVNDYEKHF